MSSFPGLRNIKIKFLLTVESCYLFRGEYSQQNEANFTSDDTNIVQPIPTVSQTSLIRGDSTMFSRGKNLHNHNSI